MVRTVALAHDSLCTAPVPMHPATIAVLHSQPLADSTPTLRSPSDYFSDTLLGEDGHIKSPATLNCTIPEILGDIKAGERVWFDDGKIGGVIKNVADSEATIEITHAGAAGSKLRPNKGINLPDSDLSIASLTPKDLEDLP